VTTDGARLRDVLRRLKNAKKAASGWQARCPAHDDKTPSLSIREGADGRVLLKCHAGCTARHITEALGIPMSSLFPERVAHSNGASDTAADPRNLSKPVAAYDYTDENGVLLFQACRFEPKTFKQRAPDGKGGWTWKLNGVRRVLYRLPDVIEAISLGRTVYITEGEKDADALTALGLTATTNPMGAGKWKDEHSATLTGADVVVLPDNDEAGWQHAEAVAASLTAHGCAVRVVQLPGVPDKGDVSDWIAAGGTRDRLEELVRHAAIGTSGPRVYSLAELYADPELTRLPPLIVPRLAYQGRVTLLAGREKSGKSTLITAAAASVSAGDAFLGEATPGAVVLYLALEEHLGDVARRFHLFNADAQRVHVVPRLEHGCADLRTLVDRYRPSLLVVDTLAALASGSVEDFNSAAQWLPLLNSLVALAHETNTATVLLHHASKANGKYRDSTAIGGAVDMIIEVNDPEDVADPTRREVGVRGRLPGSNFAFRFDGTAHVLATPISDVPYETRVLEYLRANPGQSKTAIRDAVTGSNKAIDAALSRLVASGLVEHLGDGRTSRYEAIWSRDDTDRPETAGQGRGRVRGRVADSSPPQLDERGRIRAGSGQGSGQGAALDPTPTLPRHIWRAGGQGLGDEQKPAASSDLQGAA
jgi:putative DNA primase/helicase